jgi:hypothetical protein
MYHARTLFEQPMKVPSLDSTVVTLEHDPHGFTVSFPDRFGVSDRHSKLENVEEKTTLVIERKLQERVDDVWTRTAQFGVVVNHELQLYRLCHSRREISHQSPVDIAGATSQRNPLEVNDDRFFPSGRVDKDVLGSQIRVAGGPWCDRGKWVVLTMR